MNSKRIKLSKTNNNYMRKGSHHSEETKTKLTKVKKGLHLGSSQYNWTGDKVSYASLHIWIKTHFGKASKCEKCQVKGLKRYEWANISGTYRRDINDYVQLCPSCHRLMDRGNKCRNGHEFTKENTWMRQQEKRQKMYRVCRECQRGYSRNYQNKLKK